MSEATLQPDNLVLYRNRPARVASVGDKKVDIQTEGGESISVRPKDVALLHPGPIRNLRELKPPDGEVLAAWELLAGESTTLAELAELAFADYTPASAWAVCELLADGLYFSGSPDLINAHTAEKVAAVQAARDAKAMEEQAWQAFLIRVQSGRFEPDDSRYLNDVVALALEERDQSRVLRALGREETPQNAHALLLAVGYWPPTFNPYPQRFHVLTTSPDLPLTPLPEEPRRDLTHLTAFAIDDEGSRDPDDAISWEQGRLWVHVADVAALVTPDSALDQEARLRGTNLYLPEGTITMLPQPVTDALALGLQEISPALSFGMDVADDGALSNIEITPSWVRVTRLTYADAEAELTEAPFRALDDLAQASALRRFVNGAIDLRLPEVKIRVVDGQVSITPLPALHSRDLVREAMLLTGQAVAQYALEHELALPYSVQDAPDELIDLTDGELSRMFAQRRKLRPSQSKATPAPHSGLGLDRYVQATSPLRRYADLLVHQQLRAHLLGEQPQATQTVMERIAEASSGMIAARRAERLSNTHWKLVYLLQNPDWKGDGIVVDRSGTRTTLVIPELDLETDLYGRTDLTLDAVVRIQLTDVNLPLLEANFRAVK